MSVPAEEKLGRADGPDKTTKIAKTVYEYAETIAAAVCVVFLIFNFLARTSVVSGSSMEKTLSDGDVLLVSSLPYEPKQGDIVVFRAPYSEFFGDELLIKRVIAVGGQEIMIDFDTWRVTVDGKDVDEAEYLYLHGVAKTSQIQFPFTVPEDKVFVMGDNRYNSSDSRYTDIGAVDEDYILGPAILRLYPTLGAIG